MNDAAASPRPGRHTPSSFAAGEGAWRGRLGSARDTIRQELVARQLSAHIADDPSVCLRILDAGCGQGTQAVRLARAGHRVVGLDLSPGLLQVAGEALHAEPAEVRDRVDLRQGDLRDLDGTETFDVVCCHGVLMYVPSLREGLAPLIASLAPGGLISVLTRNRAALAFRAAMAGEWVAALEGFDARTYANRIGVDDVRADEPAEVRAALEERGIGSLTWFGVRLFTDHWPDTAPREGLEPVLRVEAEAGGRDPYRALASLTHTLGRRPGNGR